MLDKAGNLYVATGDHGEIYKVTPKGEHSLFFKSDDTHIRVLALDAQGNLIAGTDGSGLVYRISPAGEGFVLYSAPKKEITALALDRAGNIYAAGVGEKRAGQQLRRLAATSTLSMGSSFSISQPSYAGMTLTSDAQCLPRWRPSRFPAAARAAAPMFTASRPTALRRASGLRMKTSFTRWPSIRMTSLLAGTGNRGHVFAINGQDEFSDLLKAPASQVTGFAKAPGGGLYAASSNLGKIFLLGPGSARAKAPTRAMCSTPRFSRAGDGRSFAAPAMLICWRAAATSTIPTATGAPGSKWIWPRILRWPFLPPAMRSGKPCCTREAPGPRSTPSP